MRTLTIQQFADQLMRECFPDGVTRMVKPSRDGTVSVNITALDRTEKALARGALEELSEVTGLTFREVTGSAQITYCSDSPGARCSSWGLGDTILSSKINIASARVSLGDGPGSYAFRTYMHETAHALGLGHPQDYSRVRSFSESGLANDSWQMSMMSYFDQHENTTVSANKAYHLTPMLADYTALRQMYGTPAMHRGDTVYGVGSTAGGTLDQIAAVGANATWLIADHGGTDHLKFTNTGAAQVIDLTPGAISSALGGRGNMQIAPDSVIERATGGAGADRITGNAVANRLRGGEGKDTLAGAAGNDTLDGGKGKDKLAGGAGDDTYIVTSGDRVIERAGAGIDTVQTATSHTLAAHVEHAVLTGVVGASLTGNALPNQLTGNAGNDRLEGGLGDDTLIGGSGIDTAVYSGTTSVSVNLSLTTAQKTGQGRDVLISIENLVGGSGHDRLTGHHLANRLEGGVGNDTINGDAGDDNLLGGVGNDVLQGGAGADRIAGGAGIDRLYGGAHDRAADVFIFAPSDTGRGAAADRVHDFVSGKDRIDLTAIDARLGVAGRQALVFGEETPTEHGVWTRASDGDLILSVDVTGDARADAEIVLVGVSSVTAGDFLF